MGCMAGPVESKGRLYGEPADRPEKLRWRHLPIETIARRK
ncbi:hypothetical protein IMCC9480_222 [Oxalobacteraceae bacterium IMCC9480]|nr:hypothetical protein IMCC9480_222 [Oxalobacteraceae bacterium IMCC9480]